MKEQLISFEASKLAKDKGFNLEVYNAYRGDNKNLVDLGDVWHYGCEGGMELEEWFYDYNSYSHRLLISAPTQSLLQRWLREVHDISIKVDDYYYNSKVRYDVNVSKLGSQEDNTKGVYETYEQALEAGLLEGLKLIEV